MACDALGQHGATGQATSGWVEVLCSVQRDGRGLYYPGLP